MKISIIIPTYNRVDDLMETLGSILGCSDLPEEIIIVDNGPSTDSTSEKVRDLAKIHPSIRYLQITTLGMVYALSVGNNNATGEIIIQMDDDVTMLNPSIFFIIRSIFSKFTEVSILGPVELKKEKLAEYTQDTSSELVIRQAISNKIATIDRLYNVTTGFELLLNQKPGLYPCDHFRGCFMAYRRSCLSILKNHDLNYQIISAKGYYREETDLLLRARNAGYKAYICNLIPILHRAGERPKNVMSRDSQASVLVSFTANHTYFATKDMIEKRQFFKILIWFFYQFFIGAYRNPGLLKCIKQKGIVSSIFFIKGFFIGFYAGIVRKRIFVNES